MAFKFFVFVAFIAVGLAWPYDRQFYDQPEGSYQRPYGGYGRPNYGTDDTYNQHGYARPNGGYGRPHGGYGRPSNVDFGNNNNWQGPISQGSQWQGQDEGQFHQQQPHQGAIPSSPFGSRFDGSSSGDNQQNPSSFGDRFGGPTTGNNFPPQVNVEPTNKIAEGVKTFGAAATPPPTSPNAPLDPNIDLTGSRVFHNSGSADASSTDTQAQTPSEGESSSNGEDLTGLPNGQQASQEPTSENSQPQNEDSHGPPSSGSLFGGAQPGEGTDGASQPSSSSSSSNNEPPVTIDPSATADSGLVLG